jgi:hypothetical protein
MSSFDTTCTNAYSSSGTKRDESRDQPVDHPLYAAKHAAYGHPEHYIIRARYPSEPEAALK